LDPLWTELAADLSSLRRAPGVDLRFSQAPRGIMRSDRRKLRIIVKNVVGNALKFTSSGRIDVELRVRRGRFALAVRDTGIGIAAEDLSRIFEMFGQARRDAAAPRPGGVGLGLYIVRQLCDQLGGPVEVEPAPDQGSPFRVDLPIDSAQSDKLAERGRASGRSAARRKGGRAAVGKARARSPG